MTALPTASHLDTSRNRIAVRLANTCLRIASSDYRRFIKGSIQMGLESARLKSLDLPCFVCGMTAQQCETGFQGLDQPCCHQCDHDPGRA